MDSSHSHLIWEEIDLTAIANNIRALKNKILPGTKFMAVVKADAYGHGAFQVAETAIQNGADMLGVARIDEALELRSKGIKAPILIFGFTSAKRASDLIKYDLTASVYTYEMAKNFSLRSKNTNQNIKIHIKVDTGMGRVGFPVDLEHSFSIKNFIKKLIKIKNLSGIDIDGIYTHFAMADGRDTTYTERQFKLFSGCLKKIKASGITIPLKHCANSAALISLPETHLDLVRAGVAIYGLYPSKETNKRKIHLMPALSLKSKIVYLKTVAPGFKISYGCTFETRKESILATVPVGYADGYSRLFSSTGEMLVRGKRAKVVGRVCMDQLILDVTHIEDVSLHDEVVIIGNQGGKTILADELADNLKTINYEIVSCFLFRVPKLYLSNNESGTEK